MKAVVLALALLVCAHRAHADEGRREIVAGSITLAAAYVIPFAFGLRWSEPELLIPVAGPLIDLHRCRDCLGSGVEKAVVTVLVLDSLAQATGATLLGVGLWKRHHARVMPAGLGLIVAGEF